MHASCCRNYSGQLQEYQDQCVTMLTELGKALEFLQEMKMRHQFVSQRTGALHQACEQLVEEEVMMITITSLIITSDVHTHNVHLRRRYSI